MHSFSVLKKLFDVQIVDHTQTDLEIMWFSVQQFVSGCIRFTRSYPIQESLGGSSSGKPSSVALCSAKVPVSKPLTPKSPGSSKPRVHKPTAEFSPFHKLHPPLAPPPNL